MSVPGHFRRIDLLRCSRPVRCPPIAAKYGQRRNHVESGFVGRRCEGGVAVHVGDGNLGVGNGGAGFVGDEAGERSIDGLAIGEEGGYRAEQQKPKTCSVHKSPFVRVREISWD